MLIYLDSDIVIYLIEQPPVFGPLARARVSPLLSAGRRFVVSSLSRIECRSNPVAANDRAILVQFDRFFNRVVERIVRLSPAVCERATFIRAKYGFTTLDALHLAAAVESGCVLFLTNDHRLARCTELTVELLT